MKNKILGLLFVAIAMSATASTFVIDWDIDEKSAEATTLSAEIFFDEKGGPVGSRLASEKCYSLVPSYEFSAESAFCMAFDEAVYIWISHDGAESIADANYFSEASIEARRSNYMREWTSNGKTEIRSRIRTAVRIQYKNILNAAMRGNENGAS